MRSTRRTALLCLLLLLGFPGWHVFCKESASSDEAAPVIDDETIKKKDEVEEPRQPEPTEDVDLKPPSQKAEVHILEDCAKDDQSENTEHISPPLVEADSSAGLEDDAPSSAESIERNISSSSTSDTPPVAPSDAIENSSADHPALSSNEAEQSEPDCDSGGALEADPQSEPSSFVSPTESLDQPLENISSRGKVKITKSDLEANIPVAANGSTKQKLSLNASEGVKEKSDSKKTGDLDPTATGGPKDPGDIPTFDEWKKQVLEVEKEKSQSMHPSPNGVPHAAKKVQKNRNNYASVECGAKMLAANPEAKSTSAILIENMDLYMLNPCSTKIWFVIELCEPIQVKQLDIANYELFSSTPKDFLVSISDRYPTNKWVKLGTFHARDERTVQSFPLDEQMYAKYVKMFIKYLKVELVSHFGSEHFCPLSLIRVFGTSMVEEYEESVDSHYQLERQDPYDDDYDYPLDYNTREDKSSKNLLGSATNAILNMVNNLAANMLGANTDEQAAGQGENVSMPDNATEAAITETVQTHTPILLEPTSVPTPGLQTPEVPLPIEEPSEPDVAKEDPIVQLVQEDDEEPRQSTVTLLGNDDQVEDKLAWFESETQVYCSELMTICCVSSFSEFIYKWCSAIVTLHRQRSKTIEVNRENDHDLATQQPLAVPTEDISADVAEQPPLEEFISNNTEEIPDVIESLPESLHHESSITKPVEAIELEPSYPQMVSQSDFLDLTSEEKTTSTAISADDTKHKAEQTLQAQTPESTLETPTEKEKTEPPAPVEMTTVSSETLTVSELEDTNTKEHTEVAPVIKSTQTAPPPETTPTVVDREVEETKGSASEILKPAVVEELESTPIPEIKEEEQPTDEALLGAHALGGLQRSATDFYAELQNSTELGYANGNLVHGSNQKESVFMRLNNRIKALEVNMSLSSRYLEELSQRYRKQMDEMQKAFNKTIIKLQNTARIAEEQDQRQTESIQLLQSQLTNMTHLVSNLSSTVSELKREVSDRQIILVVALVLALILVLMVCVQCCRNKSPLNEDCISKIPKSNNYPSPKRCFSSYDDMNLKRRTSCPLVRSQSFQLSSKEVDPNDFYIVEPLKFSPEKKKKRCKYKGENIETIKPTDAPRPIANGDLKSKKPFTNQRDFSNMGEVFHSSHKGPPSEGSSETSSQSDESLFCGITTCTNLCNGQPQKTKTEKRAIKRRRSKLQDQGKFIKSLIQTKSGSMPSLHDIIKSNKDITVGTFGVATVSGHM